MTLQIWLPPTAAPEFMCRICKTPFMTRPGYERHVKACADQIAAEIDARAEETRFLTHLADPELESWIEKNRERIERTERL